MTAHPSAPVPPDYLLAADPSWFEQMHERYRSDPASVPMDWRRFFEGFHLADSGEESAVPASAASVPAVESRRGDPSGSMEKEFRVLNLIQAYRSRAHLFTRTNPVRTRRSYSPDLDLSHFGLSGDDLSTVFQAGSEIGLGPAPLKEIVGLLEETYCASIGAEFAYIRVPERVRWLTARMEGTRNRPNFTREEKRHHLESLGRAVQFENFLHSRFPGQKRFSLSGGETLIPALHALVDAGAEQGVESFLLGMPHRGRINVLANVMGKPFQDIFEEFEGCSWQDEVFTGDVKYHLGYERSLTTHAGRSVHLELAPNPSHLEVVGPVLAGMARACIENLHGGDPSRVLPVLIHGDAAIAAQGVVYETVQMAQLDAYATGGTLHVVVNNQIGFTTDYRDGRSSTYCTDVAKVTLCPVFHVNADDVEAVILATQLALEYRQTFHTDVFLDLLGYRRHGHNESDEPRFTQPKLYRAIARQPDPFTLYRQKLAQEGSVADSESQSLETAFGATLQAGLDQARGESAAHCHYRAFCDRRRRPADLDLTESLKSGLPESRLRELGRRVFSLSPDLAVFPKVRKIYEGRMRTFEEGVVDWAIGETMALATLLADGVDVRLCGQDSERGTFSHRHAVVLSEETEEKHIPLCHVAPRQGRFSVYNSLLSEYAALGFEYGYAAAHPAGITIWEAQFGDFADGAQTLIDEYLVSAEAKWNRLNGLVLFLPHGFEGQGPDHSSARPERFLQLCAADNLVLANPSTPASLFHLLRRHASWPVKVPLVVLTPKSLLRHPLCRSSVGDLAEGRFEPLLVDASVKVDHVREVLLCSGKIYYELLAHREKLGREDVALVRLEQLYPLPRRSLESLAGLYPNVRGWKWVQEEPENMGAAGWLRLHAPGLPGLSIVARRESSVPATGFHELHEQEQDQILRQAFS